MNVRYLVLRAIRHFMPEAAARFLLRRRWIISPGLETSNPKAAVDQYLNALARYGRSIKGRRVLLLGYGGRFAAGVELLRCGAAHVVLCEHQVHLDERRNRELLKDYTQYLVEEGGQVRPRPKYITLLHGDIREGVVRDKVDKVDLVLTNSVYEHLDDVPKITSALAALTSPEGAHLHFIDLRDHYFRYPFEMLCYSEIVWKHLLNPSSNLNRWRLPDYQAVFERFFNLVDIAVVAQETERYVAARSRIRPEFKTGDSAVDAVTQISVWSEQLATEDLEVL